MTDKSPDALVGQLRAFCPCLRAPKAAALIERLQGELQDERAKLRAARAELGMVRGKCDRLREALEEGVKLYEEIVEECYEYTLEDRPLLSVGIEEWNGKVAALASEKVND